MSTAAWLIITGGAVLLGMWIGGGVAAYALREQTQDRGRHALEVLEGMREHGITFTRPGGSPTPYVPHVPTARLVAKLSQLPDPYPFTRHEETP